jgi:hypothetical protein
VAGGPQQDWERDAVKRAISQRHSSSLGRNLAIPATAGTPRTVAVSGLRTKPGGRLPRGWCVR